MVRLLGRTLAQTLMTGFPNWDVMRDWFSRDYSAPTTGQLQGLSQQGGKKGWADRKGRGLTEDTVDERRDARKHGGAERAEELRGFQPKMGSTHMVISKICDNDYVWIPDPSPQGWVDSQYKVPQVVGVIAVELPPSAAHPAASATISCEGDCVTSKEIPLYKTKQNTRQNPWVTVEVVKLLDTIYDDVTKQWLTQYGYDLGIEENVEGRINDWEPVNRKEGLTGEELAKENDFQDRVKKALCLTSNEAAVAGAAFDNVEDTNDGTLGSPSQLFTTVDAVWIGDVEHLAMSCSSGTSAFDTPRRREMSNGHGVLDKSDAVGHEVRTSVGIPERHVSPCVNCARVDAAAMRLEGYASAANSRLSIELTDGDETYLRDCRSQGLAANTAPTLVNSDKAAEAVGGYCSRTSVPLVAGADGGPGKMEGANSVGNFNNVPNQCFKMEDWNSLIDDEDQLGPLPSSWNLLSMNKKFALPPCVYGASLMADIFGSLAESQNEDIQKGFGGRKWLDGSEPGLGPISQTHIASQQEPMIFCGMGRIIVDDNSDSDRSSPENHGFQPKGKSKHKISPKAKKNRESSSSTGRKINVQSFKQESSEIPHGGWFRATTAELSSSTFSSSDSNESRWSGPGTRGAERAQRKAIA
ncbi:hypothetical protein K438DRAFT_2119892 [Mycena galopus ATCC 62051]|nr:hypothetical protein K438DRAFT_2119892 [Mycena galopus ATCC 62051]